jgi:hypothetical protein
MSSEQTVQESATGGISDAGGASGEAHATIISNLTSQIRERDQLIEKLRGVERDLSKKAARGEKMEAVVRGHLEKARESLPEPLKAAIVQYPIDQQYELVQALRASIPSSSGSQQAGFEMPVAPIPGETAAPVPPPARTIQMMGGYEQEKQTLAASGNLNSVTLAALHRKYFGRQ